MNETDPFRSFAVPFPLICPLFSRYFPLSNFLLGMPSRKSHPYLLLWILKICTLTLDKIKFNLQTFEIILNEDIRLQTVLNGYFLIYD